MTRPFRDLEFRGAVPDQKHSDGRTVYRAVATTPALDRYGEVVLPKGAIVDNFMRNPVLLENHNYAASSVGHVVNLEIGDDQIVFDFVFSSDTRGLELEQKFAAGDMNAFSIGFRPKGQINLWAPWEDAPEIKELKVAYPDGSEGVVNLTAYEQVPYTVYHKWELLEISPVAVPANPEALLLRQAEEIVRRTMEQNPVMRSFVQEELAQTLTPIMAMLAKFNDLEVKFEGAVASHSTPIVEGDWSGANARTALAKWASKDGTGKKEDMNWAKYSKGFAWFDSKNADSFGAYKLPHHTVKDGSLVAVWRGVTAAMAALLGARGGTDLDNKEAVYAHLAKHYKDFDKEAPEMKEYTEEELKAIEEMVLRAPETVVSSSDPVVKADPPSDPPVDEDEDTEDDEPVSNMGEMMKTVLNMLASIQAALAKIANDQASESETQQEHFIELQLKTANIVDMLALEPKKKEVAEPKRLTEDPVLSIDKGLITELERVAALE